MKANYPVAKDGGIALQKVVLNSPIYRDNIKRMLRAAGVHAEGLRLIVDLGCRNGDTTLGLAQVAGPNTKLVGFDEVEKAVLLARLKFFWNVGDLAILSVLEEAKLSGLGGGLASFRVDALPYADRTYLQHLPDLASLSLAMGRYGKADLIIGYQLLHWLETDADGLPGRRYLDAMFQSLAPGGTLILGTSTAFVKLLPNDIFEGRRVEDFTIENHPFYVMFRETLKGLVAQVSGVTPTLVEPTWSMDNLHTHLVNAGFVDPSIGGFLVTNGREIVVTSLPGIRATDQGVLNAISDPVLRTSRISDVMSICNNRCDQIVSQGGVDPRLDDQHIYDVVPFIMARKP